jgi:hypothetical protein
LKENDDDKDKKEEINEIKQEDNIQWISVDFNWY